MTCVEALLEIEERHSGSILDPLLFFFGVSHSDSTLGKETVAACRYPVRWREETHGSVPASSAP
jgi:hypothetical protein